MQKVFAIFLLLAMGCPFIGTRVFLLYRKSEIKKGVKEQILAGVEKSELVRLAFTPESAKKELNWEHSGEFEYRGEMYDVVKKEVGGDSLVFWCIWDKAETQINRHLEALTAMAAGKDAQHKKSLTHLLSFLKSLFFNPPVSSQDSIPVVKTPSHYYHAVQYHAPSIPPSPPPEV